MTKRVHIAILAKAPIAGYAKTRLIPALGAYGAARLQRTFTRAAVRVAVEADLGDVVLWCAPSRSYRFFRALQRTTHIRCNDQPDGDLGERMLHAATAASFTDPKHAVLIMGTDCPGLNAHHLQTAADALGEFDAVFIPAEDGGYVLVGLRRPQPGLFAGMRWSTASVMDETRHRAASLGLRICELPPLWDVDTPEDLMRIQSLEPSTNQPGKLTHDLFSTAR
ncbi:TIGR04282 family arsenosugar biosynthesis glycosyltransferase [Ramlibacter sp.]|uniref:TIGR04282 family arsenosugar biosynthesis glycosyltransferase n=1 Tax=Ramlibacter sp. TaxID=1917967 RepID=UPI001856EAB0|nr:TIGR04282 family arsenosugar biosynthesis glycosyltransferase [Ramlibacter sp.]MBA2675948.1 TIGR04282 family arsenosugar biosynthesis glycosyltransferase [Ramlibacter sp.]